MWVSPNPSFVSEAILCLFVLSLLCNPFHLATSIYIQSYNQNVRLLSVPH